MQEFLLRAFDATPGYCWDFSPGALAGSGMSSVVRHAVITNAEVI